MTGDTMNKDIAKKLIEIAEKNMSGNDVNYTITDEIEVNENVTLYLFEGEFVKSAAVGYSDGTLFVLSDWQSSRPESVSEIADYDWRTIDWREAIIVNELPRMLM